MKFDIEGVSVLYGSVAETVDRGLRFKCPIPNGDRWWVSHELMAFKRRVIAIFLSKVTNKSVSGWSNSQLVLDTQTTQTDHLGYREIH